MHGDIDYLKLGEQKERRVASQSRWRIPMYQIGCVAFRFHARDYT